MMKKARKVLCVWMLSLVSICAVAYQGKVLDTQVKVDFDQVTIVDALDYVADHYRLAIVYQPNEINADREVTLSYTGSLSGMMDSIFKDGSVDYFESNRQIILKKSETREYLPAPGSKAKSSNGIFTPRIVIPAIDTGKVVVDTLKQEREVFSDTLDFGNHTHDIPYVEYKGYPVRPAHVGFIYPMSTNGMSAKEYVNNFSFHLVGGVSAGVHGVTFAGVTNYDIDFVEGVQFAGIVNISGGYVQGLQFAGITNITRGEMMGFQFAGIANISQDTTRAGQFAGIANVNTSRATGGQFAGIANANSNAVDGASVAGIANVTPLHHRGAQIAGISNVAGSLQGAQIAGLVNVSSGRTDGFQLAGLANVGGNVRGSQLALFNFADSVSGVPIGLLSIVKYGYRRVEISGSEALHTQLAFKIGVQKFYNIFAFGYHFSGADPFEYGQEPTWAYGYGIGTELNLTRTWKLNMDLTTFDVIEKENTFSDKKLNLLNQFRLNFGAQLGRKFTIAFGPSFNVMVSELQGSDNGSIGSDLAPYTVYDKTHGDTNVKMWPGFNLALRF